MKRVLPALLCLLPAIVLAQSVRLNVKIGAQKVGTASFMHKLWPDGSLQEDLRMLLSFQGMKAEASVRGHQDKYGKSISQSYKQVQPGGASTTVDIRYGKTGATVKTNGKTKLVPYPKNAKLISPSSFWFIKTKPKKGAVDVQHSLNQNTLKWDLEKTTYAGPEKIKIGAKTFQAHKLIVPDATIWVDGKGLPVRIRLTQGGQVMIMDRI